ncbi:putative glutathione-specific gamma-glutamylcyclotransferase 2 [Drosophila nasuta]|uniref:putative glutathione-specific gamma-glutamylcyclotransferase 2 n=1 Tax=Drosophila nasuta TaxID=42062 RepID=UPI00295F49F2|nr:putative glutathione-specific gamma-glutamylcyclotransferase 2 [Drosophila nasuta]
MLRFVQGLRLSNNNQSALVADIYRHCFPHLRTQEQQRNGQLLQSFDSERSNQTESIAPTADDVWIFGYGSLVWKADFPYIDRRRGFVCGYKRRFYQHSIDHRGVPEKPGRVVTLLPGDLEADRVYGVAYRIASSQKSQVLDHLDYREKNGYERFNLHFHEYPVATEGTAIEVIMYMATQANDSYAGDVWQVPCIAKQIFTSAGPSGPNREYLFNLSIAMRELFPDVIDAHLTELVSCVQRHIEHDEPLLLERALCTEIENILHDCLALETPQQQHEELAQGLQELLLRFQRPGWRETYLHRQLQQLESS